MLFQAVGNGLRGLLRFSGRDSRSTFWIYAGFVVGLRVLASLIVAIPLTIGIVRTAIGAGGAGDTMDAQVLAQVARIAPAIVWTAVGIGIATIALLYAAFVRRLHDSGLSGWLALVPAVAYLIELGQLLAWLPTIAEAIEGAQRVAGQQPDPTSIAISPSWPGWVALVVLIVLGLRRSDPGRNRYGQGPSAF